MHSESSQEIFIYLNGQKTSVPKSARIDEIAVNALHIKHDAYAAALNQKFIQRSEWKDIMLSEGDKLEILTPVQGG